MSRLPLQRSRRGKEADQNEALLKASGHCCDRQSAFATHTLLSILGFLWVVLLTTSPALAKQITTTTYVGQHFEVREHDAPTKYVFNGSTRVAKVTGSLSANERVQHLRVVTGWNLCSLAVTAPNALQTLSASGGEGQGEVVSAAYKWNQTSSGWDVVAATDTLPAGTIIWVNVTTNCTLRVTGTYPGPAPNLRAPREGAFLPGYGLEVLPTTNLPASVAVWHFDPKAGRWSGQRPPPPLALTNFPPALGPGQAFFAQSSVPADLTLPDPALSIRFYHQDHLGSSAVISDSTGAAVEETSNYPFGHPRHQHKPKGIQEPYQFTQKERDAESGLHYFEARYFAAILGRFNGADPILLLLPGRLLSEPKHLNSYSYSLNNPINLQDPSGQESVGEIIERNGVEAAGEGNNASAYGWAFLAAAWDVFGAEGVSQIADKGTGAGAGNAVAAAIEIEGAIPIAGTVTKVGAKLLTTGAKVIERKLAARGAEATTKLLVKETATEAAKAPTRFIAGVKVIDKKSGKVLEGTVDLKPTLDRIAEGTRFPHKNDGSIFKNKEGLLPNQAPGYYTEYVHPTPGVSGPGPQRIITGKGGEIYYTPDHYDTFIPVNPKN